MAIDLKNATKALYGTVPISENPEPIIKDQQAIVDLTEFKQPYQNHQE